MDWLLRRLGLGETAEDNINPVTVKNIPETETNVGPIKIVLTLIGKFYEAPSYDEANSIVNETVKEFLNEENKIIFKKCNFTYKIDWEEFENFEEPQDSWLQDVLVDREYETDEMRQKQIITQFVNGFRIRFYSSSKEMNIADILRKGYDLMDVIIHKMTRQDILMIKNFNIVMGIIASEDVIKILNTQITEDVKEKDTLEHINVQKISDGLTLMTLYIRDRLSINLILELISNKYKNASNLR